MHQQEAANIGNAFFYRANAAHCLAGGKQNKITNLQRREHYERAIEDYKDARKWFQNAYNRTADVRVTLRVNHQKAAAHCTKKIAICEKAARKLDTAEGGAT